MPLLGFPALEPLGVVKFVDQVYVKPSSTPFNGLDTLPQKYKISLQPDAVPHSLIVPRHVPIPLREMVKAELQNLEQEGAIRWIDKPMQ